MVLAPSLPRGYPPVTTREFPTVAMGFSLLPFAGRCTNFIYRGYRILPTSRLHRSILGFSLLLSLRCCLTLLSWQ